MLDSSVFPSDQWVRARILAWITQLFEDVTVIDEAESRRSPRSLALVAKVEASGQIAWFSAPLGWSEYQILCLSGLLTFDPLALLSDRTRDQAPRRISVHYLLLGAQPKVRWFGRILEQGVALGGRDASSKTVTAVLSRQGEGLILKHSSLMANLQREAEALKECPKDLLVPRYLGCVYPAEGEIITAQSLLPGQPLPNIGPMTDQCELAVVNSLQRLVCADQKTSMLDLARCLQGELAAAPLPPDQRSALEKLVAGVFDQRILPASRLHGDLRPMNILACPLAQEGKERRYGIGLLDWEFSRSCGLGVTDYLRLALDSGYRDSRSFAELLSPARLGHIQAGLGALNLPGADFPLDGLLRLHVVTHALDRLVSFGNGQGLRMSNLRSMLASPWPL